MSNATSIPPSMFDHTQQRAAGPASAPGDGASSAEPLNAAQFRDVLRDPVRWILALAHGLAMDDPVESAAVHRARSAIVAQLAGQPGALRRDDLLTVCGLLISALDPAVVEVVLRRVAEAVDEVRLAALYSVPFAIHYGVTRVDAALSGRAAVECTSPMCCLHSRRIR